MQYQEQSFNLPDLKGLSAKQVEEHLKLYSGYVKHVNLVRDHIADFENDPEKYGYELSELRRRFSFEFDGMRMHEYYFEQWENGSEDADTNSKLAGAVSEKYGSWEKFVEHFKTVGKTRGIGWTVLYWDPRGNTPHITWVGDHELGVLAGLPIIMNMDMWEHAFMVDYTPSEKAQYIDAFFDNLNWKVIENRFEQA